MGFGIRYSVWVLVMLLIIFNTFENSLNFSESNFLIFVLEQQSLCHRIIKGSKGHGDGEYERDSIDIKEVVLNLALNTVFGN